MDSLSIRHHHQGDPPTTMINIQQITMIKRTIWQPKQRYQHHRLLLGMCVPTVKNDSLDRRPCGFTPILILAKNHSFALTVDAGLVYNRINAVTSVSIDFRDIHQRTRHWVELCDGQECAVLLSLSPSLSLWVGYDSFFGWYYSLSPLTFIVSLVIVLTFSILALDIYIPQPFFEIDLFFLRLAEFEHTNQIKFPSSMIFIFSLYFFFYLTTALWWTRNILWQCLPFSTAMYLLHRCLCFMYAVWLAGIECGRKTMLTCWSRRCRRRRRRQQRWRVYSNQYNQQKRYCMCWGAQIGSTLLGFLETETGRFHHVRMACNAWLIGLG